jgi:hypothetical protein
VPYRTEGSGVDGRPASPAGTTGAG